MARNRLFGKLLRFECIGRVFPRSTGIPRQENAFERWLNHYQNDLRVACEGETARTVSTAKTAVQEP